MSEDEGGKVYRKGAGRADLLGNTKGGREAETGFDHVTETSGELSWAMCGRGESFCFPPFPQDSCNLWQFLLT